MTGAPDFSVAGLRVLITGGTGGIGGAFARAFAACGAVVTVTDLKPPSDPLPDGVTFEALDVRDDGAIGALAARTPRLDVLIHCAGVIARGREYEIEAFKDVLDIHLVGAMRMATAFRPTLARAKGSILFIGSMFSFFGTPRIPAYASAKTAIVGLTRSLALGFAADGIRVNAMAPGWIETDLSRGALEDPVVSARILDRLPNRRFAKPDDLAGTAVFLASPAAALITGITIPVDDGYVAS